MNFHVALASEQSFAGRCFEMETRLRTGMSTYCLAQITLNSAGQTSLQGIAKHSKLNVEMAPPQSLMDRIGLHECAREWSHNSRILMHREAYRGTLHVYPGFIEWCRYLQQVFGAYWVHTSPELLSRTFSSRA